jgi:transcriptional regulator with XRE-family HTH domain
MQMMIETRTKGVLQGMSIEFARTRLRLSKSALARILGVDPSAIYRWEHAREPSIDPFHERLLEVVITISTFPRSAELGLELEKASMEDPLRALYLLLGMAFNDWSQDA